MPALSKAAEQVSANVGRRIDAAPAAAVLAIAALAAAQPLDADLWVHLNNGRFIASRGELPYPDPFTFSAGDAVWTVHEWLPALIIYQLVDLGGVVTAVLGIAAVYAITWGLLERTLAAHGVGPWMRTAAMVTASLPLFPFAGIRPLAFGLLAAVLAAVLALHHRRTGSRWIWLLPLVFVIWGNVHASFPIGFALLGAILVEALWAQSRPPFIGPRPRTRLGPFAAVTALSAAAPALNPSGLRLLAQPFFQWGGEFRRFNSDWRPPDAFSETWWFFAAFLVLTGLLLVLRRGRVTPVDVLVLVVVVAAGYSTRKVMPFATVLAPLLLAHPLATAGAARLPLPPWVVRAGAMLAVAAAIGVAAAISPRTLDGPTVVPMPARPATSSLRPERRESSAPTIGVRSSPGICGRMRLCSSMVDSTSSCRKRSAATSRSQVSSPAGAGYSWTSIPTPWSFKPSRRWRVNWPSRGLAGATSVATPLPACFSLTAPDPRETAALSLGKHSTPNSVLVHH